MQTLSKNENVINIFENQNIEKLAVEEIVKKATKLMDRASVIEKSVFNSTASITQKQLKSTRIIVTSIVKNLSNTEQKLLFLDNKVIDFEDIIPTRADEIKKALNTLFNKPIYSLKNLINMKENAAAA